MKRPFTLSDTLQRAKLQGKRPRIVTRHNGAVDGSPVVYQISIAGEYHGWFDRREDAKNAISNP